VIGANACAAALLDRLRCGKGREIHASRIAGGLSAIGALCLKQRGLPPHLDPVPAIYKSEADILAKRRGIEPSELDAYKQAAISDPAKQAWLFQRLYPFMAPYKCSDGEWILPMATFNRRLATGYCAYLGFADDVSAFGIVDRDPYDPASAPFDDRNLALPIGFNFPSSCKAAHRNLCLSSAVARLHLRCISSALPLPPARWRSCSKPSFSRRRRWSGRRSSRPPVFRAL